MCIRGAVCFVYFVYSWIVFYAKAKNTIHELHEIHELTRTVAYPLAGGFRTFTQIFRQRFVGSLNVDGKPTAKRLDQALLVRKRTGGKTTFQVLDLTQQALVLQ